MVEAASLTHEAIARALGICRQRVVQLEQSALARLRGDKAFFARLAAKRRRYPKQRSRGAGGRRAPQCKP